MHSQQISVYFYGVSVGIGKNMVKYYWQIVQNYAEKAAQVCYFKTSCSSSNRSTCISSEQPNGWLLVFVNVELTILKICKVLFSCQSVTRCLCVSWAQNGATATLSIDCSQGQQGKGDIHMS